MIVCMKCGHHNEDGDDFCGSCGAFLEWEGQALEPEQPEPPEPEPEPELEPEGPQRGLVDRVKEIVGLDEDQARAAAEVPGVAEAVAAADTDEAEEDVATRIRADAAEAAERKAAEAERAREEARTLRDEHVEAAEEAAEAAEAAEQARRDAEARAAEEATEARELQRKLEAAEQERQQLEEERQQVQEQLEEVRRQRDAELEEMRSEKEQELAQESERAERAEAEAEQARQAAAAREDVEASATREAEDLRARLAEAEKAREEATARAEAETQAAEEARRQAELAAEAREEAQRRLQEEAEAAEKARRAAALVARPAPKVRKQKQEEQKQKQEGQEEQTSPANSAAPVEARSGPGPQRPAARPRRSRRTQRERQTETKRRLRPGDLVCGNCGEGNDPERNFCRRCGSSLAEAEPAPKPSIWSRIVGLFRREPERYEAGARPMRAGAVGAGGSKGAAARAGWRRILGGWTTVMKALAAIAVVGGMIGLSISPMRADVTGWIGDRFASLKSFVVPTYEPVNAVGAVASSATAEHPADHAVDLLKNTWWAEGAPGPGDGSQLFVEFGDPVDIVKVGFLNGAADEDVFVAQPRPREVHLVFSNGATADMTLADSSDFQVFDVEGAEQVTNVEVQILSVYSGQSGEDMALTEVEFRTRK